MNALDYDFFALLKKLLNVNNRDTAQLIFKQNAGNNSIYLGPYKLFQFYNTKQNSYICCRNNTLPLVEKYKVPYKKSAAKSDNFAIRISADDIQIINMIAPFWIALYDDVYIKNSRDTFSCCSRWLECSNALECTNPDKSDARLCKYKRNLEKGLIFEGTYSVIDEHGAIDYDKVKRNASLLKRSEIILINVNEGVL